MVIITLSRRKLIAFLLILIIFLLIFINFDFILRLIYPLRHEQLITNNAQKYSLDPYMIAAIIYVESKFSDTALSDKGAMGLMQIMPETGKWIASRKGDEEFTGELLYEPTVNIDYGSWYFANLKDEFDGDLIYTLAAYNAGRGTMKNWLAQSNGTHEDLLENFPFLETRNYVRRTLNIYQTYKELYELD